MEEFPGTYGFEVPVNIPPESPAGENTRVGGIHRGQGSGPRQRQGTVEAFSSLTDYLPASREVTSYGKIVCMVTFRDVSLSLLC